MHNELLEDILFCPLAINICSPTVRNFSTCPKITLAKPQIIHVTVLLANVVAK